MKKLIARLCLFLMCGISGLAFVTGCANTHCRKIREAEGIQAPPIKKELDPLNKVSTSQRVYVYKPDGSRQCEKGRPIPLEQMRKELVGVSIYSSFKRHDGLLRASVCGQLSGESNVFEIDGNDLERALSAGFREWPQ